MVLSSVLLSNQFVDISTKLLALLYESKNIGSFVVLLRASIVRMGSWFNGNCIRFAYK